MKELEYIGKTWSEAENTAKIRVRCRAIVEALYLTRDKEG